MKSEYIYVYITKLRTIAKHNNKPHQQMQQQEQPRNQPRSEPFTDEKQLIPLTSLYGDLANALAGEEPAKIDTEAFCKWSLSDKECVGYERFVIIGKTNEYDVETGEDFLSLSVDGIGSRHGLGKRITESLHYVTTEILAEEYIIPIKPGWMLIQVLITDTKNDLHKYVDSHEEADAIINAHRLLFGKAGTVIKCVWEYDKDKVTIIEV